MACWKIRHLTNTSPITYTRHLSLVFMLLSLLKFSMTTSTRTHGVPFAIPFVTSVFRNTTNRVPMKHVRFPGTHGNQPASAPRRSKMLTSYVQPGEMNYHESLQLQTNSVNNDTYMGSPINIRRFRTSFFHVRTKY